MICSHCRCSSSIMLTLTFWKRTVVVCHRCWLLPSDELASQQPRLNAGGAL